MHGPTCIFWANLTHFLLWLSHICTEMACKKRNAPYCQVPNLRIIRSMPGSRHRSIMLEKYLRRSIVLLLDHNTAIYYISGCPRYLEGLECQVSKLSRKDAKFAQKLDQLQLSLIYLYSHRNARANLRLLGQPDTFLAHRSTPAAAPAVRQRRASRRSRPSSLSLGCLWSLMLRHLKFFIKYL
jgi:hypothetical protein